MWVQTRRHDGRMGVDWSSYAAASQGTSRTRVEAYHTAFPVHLGELGLANTLVSVFWSLKLWFSTGKMRSNQLQMEGRRIENVTLLACVLGSQASSVLTMCRLLFSCHYSLNSTIWQCVLSIYIVSGVRSNLLSCWDDLNYTGGCVKVICKYWAISCKGLEHPKIFESLEGPETNPPQIPRHL